MIQKKILQIGFCHLIFNLYAGDILSMLDNDKITSPQPTSSSLYTPRSVNLLEEVFVCLPPKKYSVSSLLSPLRRPPSWRDSQPLRKSIIINSLLKKIIDDMEKKLKDKHFKLTTQPLTIFFEFEDKIILAEVDAMFEEIFIQAHIQETNVYEQNPLKEQKINSDWYENKMNELVEFTENTLRLFKNRYRNDKKKWIASQPKSLPHFIE